MIFLVRMAALVAALAVGATPLFAQEESSLFARKSITVYVGNTAGGTYDLMARLLSRHLGRFLPGAPNIVVENMPGAGTLRAANYVTSVAPKDGTALGIVTETIAIEQALRNPAAQYDASKLTWIGRLGASNAVLAMWHSSKVQSIADAMRYEAPVAGTGAGNIAEVIPTLLNALMPTKFNIVRGYPAAAEAMLAMERGEVEGCMPNWITIKVGKADWLRDKKVKVILQVQNERGADLADVPALGELGDTVEAKQIFQLYGSVGSIGRAFFAPPGTNPQAAAALRAGFTAMSQDADFLADARKSNAELAIGSGAALQAAITHTLAVPESTLERARAIFKR